MNIFDRDLLETLARGMSGLGRVPKGVEHEQRHCIRV